MPLYAERRETWRALSHKTRDPYEPVGHYADSNSTAAADTDGVTFFVYMGRTMRQHATVVANTRILTAYAPGIGGNPWAEIGIFTGPFVFNAATSLTRLGYTDVSGSVTSTGIKRDTITITPIPTNTPIWFAWGQNIEFGGTRYDIAGTLRPQLQEGILQWIAGQPSALSVPVSTTLGATGLRPARVRITL